MKKKHTISGKEVEIRDRMCDYCTSKATHMLTCTGWMRHVDVPLCEKHHVLWHKNELSI